jgi:hypothetical protein
MADMTFLHGKTKMKIFTSKNGNCTVKIPTFFFKNDSDTEGFGLKLKNFIF